MSRKWTLRRILNKAAKILGIIVVSVCGLLVLIALAIQIPAVQSRLVQRAVTFVQDKIGTRVSLDHISLSFPKALVLDGIYLEDQKKDTLLFVGKLSIDTDLWALTRNTIELNDITMSEADIRIQRSGLDSAFNFDYIIDAFSSGESAADTTPSEPWVINVEDVHLTDIHVAYLDSIAGIDSDVRLHELALDVDHLDFNGPDIRIGEVVLNDVQARLVSWIAPDTSAQATQQIRASTDSSTFNIGFKKIELRDIAADYRQTILGQHARLNLGTLSITAESIDLIRKVIALEGVELSNTFLSYQQSSGQSANKDQAPSHQKGSKANTTEKQPAHASPGMKRSPDGPLDFDWKVSVNEVTLSNNNVQYYDFTIPASERGVDFSHLWLTRLALSAEDLTASRGHLAGNIQDLKFSDRSGLSLDRLTARVEVNDTAAAVRDLIVHTPRTQLQAALTASYRSLSTITNDYPDARFSLAVEPSSIGVSDVLMFVPQLLNNVPVHLAEESIVRLETRAEGAVKDLRLNQFSVALMDSTRLALNGRVTGLPEKSAQFNIDLKTLHTTRRDVVALLPDTLLPTAIALPSWLSLTGDAGGSFDDPAGNFLLKSDMGTVKVNAKLEDIDGNAPAYSANVDLTKFDVGRLLKQETMGAVTLHASAVGKGFTQETLNTRIDLVVREFLYQNYTYRDFNVHGSMVKYLFSGKAWIKDPNIDFNLEGDLDYTGDVPVYSLKFDLKNADFRALHLSERPLKARGIFETKLATSDFTSINGNLDIRKFGIYNGESLYLVDSLLFASIDQKGESKISIRSDIISGDFEGTINLVAMPEALRRHFNRYFSLRDPAYSKPTDRQQFTFNLVIKNTELITEILIPELEPFIPGRIEGKFDSDARSLELHADVARIQYGAIGLDSLSLSVSSDAEALDYTLGLRKMRYDTLRMEALRVTGKVANDSIRTKLLILDSLLKDKYALGGAFYSQSDAIQFRFLEDEVVMNYAPWTTPADNYLRFTKRGILAHNFSITNINEKISLVTREESDARTAIEFKDLNLQNLTNIVESNVLIDGLINGDFMLSGGGEFRTALTIKALEVLGVEWGDLGLKLSHENSGQFLVDLGVNGINMEFAAKGTYIPDSIASKIDLTTDISRINLIAIEPLTGGQLKNSSGSIGGEVTLRGSPTSPEIRGFVAFQKATVVPTFVNSKFILQDERIAFTGEGIILENFRILDEQNNSATIKGALRTKDYSSFDLDLKLNAQNFQLLNTPEDANAPFYGKVGINTTTTILGPITEPKINMNVSLNDDSHFTYIIPQSEKGVLEQKGIVRWVDKDAAKDPFLKGVQARDTLATRFTGIDLTANIQLDDKEQLSIVIDPLTGDKLSVKGNSTLTLDINPSGDMQLAGRYEITEGTYDFTFYRLVKRNFKIDKGSTITWSGDPLEAILDIQASYAVETSPIELMSSQVSTTSQAELNTWKQRLPFLVYLHIDGELMTPEISFELDMPEEKRNALGGQPYGRIKDINTRESDVNKQVFALLILKRFISDNVFDNQGGSSTEATARRSVSKLLSEQLNKMSENVKGVELTFDVRSDEDYSTGEAQGQTAVQLGVSKSLLNDRLIVKVSGNVDIEGEKSNQNSFTDYIGDLALEYKLTEDGRFRITGFRNSDYDIISGELIETGAGLIYIKDYNTLRELFKANAKNK